MFLPSPIGGYARKSAKKIAETTVWFAANTATFWIMINAENSQQGSRKIVFPGNAHLINIFNIPSLIKVNILSLS